MQNLCGTIADCALLCVEFSQGCANAGVSAVNSVPSVSTDLAIWVWVSSMQLLMLLLVRCTLYFSGSVQRWYIAT
jgi:hypothetical protein